MKSTSMICTLSNMDILHLFCIKCTNFIRDRESLRTTKSYTILLGWYWNQWSYWICNFQHHACDSRMCIGCHAWLLLKLVVRYTRLWSLSNLHCSFVGNYFKWSNILVRNTRLITVGALYFVQYSINVCPIMLFIDILGRRLHYS